ncbi:hypothetical protein [uncultured Erythrobacter sp.]|uniref:hypothetical protein n=1 Tax=uncultured Erythrobacter sp. TaxID=263913 RepID=UPI00260DFC9D|nr:hypothetical protein [uncultured Erythrobacter sp.]
MQRLIQISSISLALMLAGCQEETEESADITEAIPLNSDDSSPDAAGEGGEEASGDSSNLSAASSDGETSGERSLPESMQSGSNPPNMTEPPKGSKVQRVN